ncbi:MAG TPA: amino acid ABC transporter substrate-binding protein [Methylomirabilota bacterium]
MKLLGLLLALFALSPLPAWAQSIKVGAVVPLTGRYGAGGAQVRAGYEIAVEQVNAAGGVSVAGKKMPLELVLLDDESDATKTVSRLETLAAQGVVAYLGGFGSDLHAAAASVAEKNKISYLGVAFALHKVHQQGFRYLFSPFWKSPDIGHQLPGMLNSIPAAERPKTVAIFQEKTDWGREMSAAWTEAGKAAGYQVVVNADYAPGAKDFSDLILKAKAAGADAVFALPTPPDGMTMVKQMKELAYSPKLTLFIRAPDPPIWTKNLGKDGDFVVLAPGWHHAVKAPGVKELNDAHTKKIGRPADPIVGPAYACVQILAAAAARGGADREKLRDAIAATDMTTVVGPVKFRPDGTGVVQSVFLQWLNGKQELVWPKESATAPLAYPAPPFGKR